MAVARVVAATRADPHTARAMPGSRLDDERDEDLMLAYARGEAAAFDVLYARHKGGVYRYLLRHCGHAGAADELFQDIWMNVIRVRANYTPSAKFATRLYTLAHNRLVDHWRASGQATISMNLGYVFAFGHTAPLPPGVGVFGGGGSALLPCAVWIMSRRPTPK